MSDGGLTGSARVLAILRCLGERPAGARLGDVRQRFYGVSGERRLTHPAVVALSNAARHEIFRAPRRGAAAGRPRREPDV